MTELRAVHVSEVRGLLHLDWAQGGDFMLPANIVGALEAAGQDAAALEFEALPDIPDLDVAAQALRSQCAFTPHPPTSSRLPISYQRVPQRVRNLVGRVIGVRARRRMDRWAHFPRWPLDLSADFLVDLSRTRDAATAPAPVLLSHDLDTAEGLENFVRWFAPMEEEVGARSANYIVPCGWPLDHSLLAQVCERGHEVGVHGFDHSNRTPFCDDDERAQRIHAASDLIARYQISGYRAPSLVRTEALLAALVPVYSYDSSIPTSGGLFPVPNNGCASARPYSLLGIREIPLTMPRDGSLRFLGISPARILEMWKKCATTIAASGGVVSLLTHCEARFSGHPEMREVYAQLLRWLADDARFEFSTTQAVLRHSFGGGNDA